jgi:hypothetical protein
MARAEQVAARVTFARDLIEAGLPDATVARRLMTAHSISRTTAYVDVASAHEQIIADDNGPSEAEIATPNTAGMIAALLYDAQRCQETGDYVAMQRLIRSADTLKRWGGVAATL